MKLSFSKALQDKLNKEGSFDIVINYIRDQFFIRSIVNYIMDWRYKSTAVNCQEWIKANGILPNKPATELSDLKYIKNQTSKVTQALAYIRRNITYKEDSLVWKTEEKWQTPQETWLRLSGDCEDGAVLLYTLLNWLGVPDNRLYIVAGDVAGGGHCYLVYTADDGLEYPIDWCYWPTQSASMKVPYNERAEYFYGEKEWFRFNKSGAYLPKDL